ncbi:hypothetical protein NDN08_004811 [Rhodosorus marinus]|uniref:Enoyl reductase (ER) domain-containing protein n=1 Tax=Rhodosorus marinus TaxID=101924 RepID=A0AAV8UME9_9RHOD|nr:hypothetical protein NDN08_004811 [Rhodosorus marinus]
MKAWKITEFGSVDVMNLVDDFPIPEMKSTDILVKNKAVGSNPIDYKARGGATVVPSEDNPRIVGWDAAGVVEQIGSDVVGFNVGDEVYYAGDIMRPLGSYAEFTAVDYRIVGKKPKSLSWAEASTIALVAITAWETMKEDMVVEEGSEMLIINGAGGLGCMAIQLAKQLGLTVIATASRQETVEWCKKMGADHVITHREPLAPQLEKLGYAKGVRYVFHCHEVGNELGELMKNVVGPLGKLSLTFSPKDEGAFGTIDTVDMWFNRKALLSTMMFARPFTGVNPEKQGELLDTVADMIDAGKITPVVTKTMKFEEAKEVMELQASGSTIGKIAMTL